MGRTATYAILLALAVSVVACNHGSRRSGTQPQHKPRQSSNQLETAFNAIGPIKKGRLMVEPVKFTRIARNIEDERWEADLRITSHADLDTLCNVTLRIYDAAGKVLQEYIIFNDAVPYMGTINHSDVFFVERKALPLVDFAGFEFNCVMEEILEE